MTPGKSPSLPYRKLREQLMFGGAIAIAFCTALAGCSGSKGNGDQGSGGGNTPPTAGTVSISGTFAVGQTLTAVPSGFTLGTPAGSYHYTWQSCTDSSCTSATAVGTDSATYTLAAADAGSYVRAGVYASNTCAWGCGSSPTVYSAAAIVIAPMEWANWPMPDSGTIFCTNGALQVVCPSSGTGYGQDGNYLTNLPSYTTTTSTVLDNVTGLRWQRDVPSVTYTWADAKTYCAGLGTLDGYSGWRLPTRIELISIVDIGRYGPAIDTTAFPATPSAYFWSSSLVAFSPGSAWSVLFNDGYAPPSGTSNNYRVRCVR